MKNLKREKETIEGDRGKPAKDSLTVKLVVSLELKYNEWMNSRTHLGLVRLDPFYREFGVDLLVRCH